MDLQARTLSFSSAGHPSPSLLRGETTSEFVSPGFPVGVVARPEYELQVIQLSDADRVYIYSDGVIEQLGASGQQYGIPRLMQQLREHRSASLQSSIDQSLAAVLQTTADGKSDDDISMLGIQIQRG